MGGGYSDWRDVMMRYALAHPLKFIILICGVANRSIIKSSIHKSCSYSDITKESARLSLHKQRRPVSQ